MAVTSICFLSSQHPPRDKRVFDKEAVSLAAAGLEAIHIAPGPEGSTRESGVKIITYGGASRLRRLPLLYRLAKQTNADVYHCNELDSWIVGLGLKLFCGKRVVFDVHEHYTSRFAERFFPKALHPAAAAFMRTVMALLARPTDRLVLAKRSVAADFPGSKNKQVLVQNFTRMSVNGSDNRDGADSTRNSSGIVTAIHLGLISKLRGWPQLVEALRLVDSAELRLHIVGEFNDGSQPEFERAIDDLGLRDRIVIEPWMRFEEAYKRIRAADIGLILFQPGIGNHQFALPHKLFDYMLAGLAVVAPHFAEEVSSIVLESDCGLLVDTSNPQDIARALNKLLRDPEERKRLGRNGTSAVLERYNWECEAEKLVHMYHDMEP